MRKREPGMWDLCSYQPSITPSFVALLSVIGLPSDDRRALLRMARKALGGMRDVRNRLLASGHRPDDAYVALLDADIATLTDAVHAN